MYTKIHQKQLPEKIGIKASIKEAIADLLLSSAAFATLVYPCVTWAFTSIDNLLGAPAWWDGNLLLAFTAIATGGAVGLVKSFESRKKEAAAYQKGLKDGQESAPEYLERLEKLLSDFEQNVDEGAEREERCYEPV